jgi:Mn2+/Fe2+ NRAMP family transporter
MAAAVQMLVGGPAWVWLVAISAVVGTLQVLVPYAPYARVLKYLALSLFAYVIAVALVPQQWGDVLRATFVPTIRWDATFFTTVVAVLGTRLSPYALVWQPAHVVEEKIDDGHVRLADRVRSTGGDVRAMQVDVMAGALVANLVTWAIMVTTSTTLHERGITNVTSATQAADALRPAAGTLAYAIFALGILATGFLAIPVLAGGIGYAFGEARGWRRGLGREPQSAKSFYAVIVLSIVVAVLLNFLGINPIRALVLSQLINGLVAVPLIFLVLRICNDSLIMGQHTNGPLANVLGWGTFGIVAAAGVAALWGIARGG